MPSRLKDFDRLIMVMGCVQLCFCWKDRSRWDMEIATDVWSGWAHGRSAPVIPHSDVRESLRHLLSTSCLYAGSLC